MLDLLIKNGRIFSGEENPWFKGDIGVEEGRIVAIGNLVSEHADMSLDVKGLVICPGFIDVHSHSDLMWLENPRCEAKVMQGVTTEVLAQDGFSAAPVKMEHIPLLRRLVSGLLGDPDIDWDWRSLGDFLQKFERHPISVNVATLVPHGNVRISVMEMEKRMPSSREMDEMRELLVHSMDEGGLGLSTGLIYPPCNYAQKEELVELCTIVSEYEGYLAVHIRNEAERAEDSIREVLEIGEESGVSVHIDHFKSSGKTNWGKASDLLRLVEKGRNNHLEVTVEQYPYTAGSTSLWALLPPWILEGGLEKTFERLMNPLIRNKIKQQIRDGLSESIDEWENVFRDAGWDRIVLSSLRSERHRHLVGENLAKIAEIMGEDPEDSMFNLLVEEGGAVTVVVHSMSEVDVRTIMKHPLQMFCTDGLLPPGKPHPRAYGTYPRVLGRYVREEQVLSLEKALRKMTSYPAQRLRLYDRGVVRKGMWADLVIFNPIHVNDRATYSNPEQYPEGIEYVIVNGKITVRRNTHTGERAGKVLKPLLNH